MVPRNSTPGGFAYIWQSKWVEIIAIKNERTQIHFLSDVLIAVASLDLKVPILPGNQWWVASRNVGCFLKLRFPSQDVLPNANKKPSLAETRIRQKLFNSLTFKDTVSGLQKLFSRSVLIPLSFFCHCISRNSPSVRSKKSETWKWKQNNVRTWLFLTTSCGKT